MRTIICLLLFLLLFSQINYTQHLPHKIDTQWHYNTTMFGGTNYAAILKERELINGIYYFKIDRHNAQTGELLETVYDRMEGDSLYIRKVACPEELIINFDWPIGHIEVTALGNECFNFKKLVSKFSRDIFGLNTLSYKFVLGNFCEGYSDTLWFVFQPEISRELGCYYTDEGLLVGAVINGLTYGTLYPLPVELLSFTAQQSDETSVLLKWTTGSETNNAGYEILNKRYEENSWQKIAFIDGRGTTAEKQYYQYSVSDIKPGTWFFRIIQYDHDGTNKLIGEKPVHVVTTPGSTSLKQNYPNPFNPETTLEYYLADNQNVRIKIYDTMGREITTLVNEYQPAGIYKINFNAGNLSSGVYIYTMEAGEYFRSGQMIYLK